MFINRREKKTDRIKGKSSIPGRILLVDDHAAFRSEFMACFTEYDIIEASNGEEALDIMRKPNGIDLVILDVIMPGIDGIQILGEIRKINSNVGIIIQTGYDAKELFLEALREKADDYLAKPLNIDAARKAIERLLPWTLHNRDKEPDEKKKRLRGGGNKQ
jgi:DNA-binding NtrC family response regulator